MIYNLCKLGIAVDLRLCRFFLFKHRFAIVSLSFNLSFTDDNISYFDGQGTCRADWGNLRFKDENGKSHFDIYSSVKYSEKNVSSVSGVISAIIPTGYSEGEREELWTGDYAGTYYVYEWRAVGSE